MGSRGHLRGVDSRGAGDQTLPSHQDGLGPPRGAFGVDNWSMCSRTIARVVSRELQVAGNRSVDDRADVVQSTWLKVGEAERRGYIDGSSDHFAAYVATIARNTARDWNRRRRSAKVVAIEALDELAVDSDSQGQLDEQHLLDMIDGCLSGLPSNLRQVFRMRFDRGMSQLEVARVLGLSRQQVRTIETRLKETIRSTVLR